MYKVDQIEAISQNCDTILICGSQFMLNWSFCKILLWMIHYDNKGCYKIY